jgi:hypothetical protein
MSETKKPRRVKPKTRAEFVALEDRTWEEMTAEWSGLSNEELVAARTCGQWSVKDVMNHLAAWQEATLKVVPLLLRGEKPPSGEYNVQRFNVRQQNEDKDRPLAETRRRLDKSRRELLALLQTVPEELLLNVKGHIGKWAKFDTYNHYDLHAAAVREHRRRAETGAARAA